jgi:hypothetical protein
MPCMRTKNSEIIDVVKTTHEATFLLIQLHIAYIHSLWRPQKMNDSMTINAFLFV